MKTFSELRHEISEATTFAPSNKSNFPVVRKPTLTPTTVKPAGMKTIGSGSTSALRKALPSAAKTTLGGVGKAALGAAGRLASKYSPHVAALSTGYDAGKALNKIPAVNKQTSKVGKGLANVLQKTGMASKPSVNKAATPNNVNVNKMALTGKTFDPIKASLSAGYGKDLMAKSSIQTPNKRLIGPMVKGAAPSAPKPAAPKPAAKSMPSKQQSGRDSFLQDLRASAAKMKSATSDMASKTGAMKAATQKLSGSIK